MTRTKSTKRGKRSTAPRAAGRPTLEEGLIQGLTEVLGMVRSGEFDRRVASSRAKHTARHAKLAPPRVWTGAQIKALRGQLGVSQAVLADILAVSTAAVQSWEGGKNPPPSMCRLLEYISQDRQRWMDELSGAA
jgi:DNA-binding transcriptional regulator YiaG